MSYDNVIALPTSLNFKNLIGQRFGALIVIEFAGRTGKYREPAWRCACACGTSVVVAGHSLKRKLTRSCGNNVHKQLGATSPNHPLRRVYTIWCAMWQRCTDKGAINYERYGARGITVCVEWEDFKTFVSNMGPCPSRSHSLDRINNDGNYEPGNCQWAPRVWQNYNQRRHQPA